MLEEFDSFRLEYEENTGDSEINTGEHCSGKENNDDNFDVN